MTSIKSWLDRLLGRDRGTGEDAGAAMGERPETMTPGVGGVEGAPSSPTGTMPDRGMSSASDDMPSREQPPPSGTG